MLNVQQKKQNYKKLKLKKLQQKLRQKKLKKINKILRQGLEHRRRRPLDRVSERCERTREADER